MALRKKSMARAEAIFASARLASSDVAVVS